MRLRKDITLVLMKVEKQIIGVLQAHNLVTKKSKKLQSAELTPEAQVLIGQGDELVTDEWILEWRKLWPSRQRGNMAIIRRKLNRFIREEEVELDKILQVTKRYLEDQSEDKFAGNANYFFYKKTDDGEISRCQEYLEVVNDKSEPDEIFGGEIIFDEE